MKLLKSSRISRRLGERFFFKAERDSTAKSAMVRRPYPPGLHGKKRRRAPSQYGLELQEKQKVRFLYGLSDTALKRYVREAGRPGDSTKTEALLQLLEQRLDNVVFRLGFTASRRIARQVVSHGHIAVNDHPVRTPSRHVRPGDRISIREISRSLPIFDGFIVRLKKYQPPEWLMTDPEAWSGSMSRLPQEANGLINYNLSRVIGFYSR